MPCVTTYSRMPMGDLFPPNLHCDRPVDLSRHKAGSDETQFEQINVNRLPTEHFAYTGIGIVEPDRSPGTMCPLPPAAWRP